MSAISRVQQPPIKASSSTASSSHPRSPLDQYRQDVERVTATLREANVERKDLVSGEEPDRMKLDAQGNSIIPGVIGTSGTVTGVGLGLRILGEPAKRGVSTSLPKVLNARNVGIAAGVIAVTGLITATGFYYMQEHEINRIARRAFESFESYATQATLLETVEEAIREKEEKPFNKAFDYFNPMVGAYLLLIKGIAQDSGSNHQAAREEYERALEFNVDDDMRNRIHFAYARSLLFSDAPEAEILARINMIPQNSHFYTLADMEYRIKNGEKILDDDMIPSVFKCSITLDIMSHPVYYERDNHRHYFDGNAIHVWLTNHNTCPNTRQDLTISDLHPATEREAEIQVWREMQLRPTQAEAGQSE